MSDEEFLECNAGIWIVCVGFLEGLLEDTGLWCRGYPRGCVSECGLISLIGAMEAGNWSDKV